MAKQLKIKTVASVFVMTAILAVSLGAQSRTGIGEIEVPLKLDTSTKSFLRNLLFCDTNYKCGLFQDESEKTGLLLKESVPIKVVRTGKDFRIDIANKQYLLRPNSSIVANVRLGRLVLPIEISHEPDAENGSVSDSFSATARYRATGIFRSGACTVNLALNDLNRNGRFDLLDAQGGSNLQLDRNNDGKFWGRNEANTSNEIIEICGQNYLVSGIADSTIKFTKTNLKLAKVGNQVPEFSLKMVDGAVITSETQKGRAYVLDFWASWCAPCVANLPNILRLKEERKDSLDVISVNVDAPSKRSVAEEIIQKYGISKFSSIRGLGDNDPLWKTFGGMNLNRLSIPLYVLIGPDGVIRYADNGGDALIDLRNAIKTEIDN